MRPLVFLLSACLAGAVALPSSAEEQVAQRQEQSLRRAVQPDAEMPDAKRMDFDLGFGLFKRNWVAAPSSTQAVDGLGPLYNARSCNVCHPGGGRPTALLDRHGDPVAGLTVHLGQAAKVREAARPDPVYGEQIQTQALPGQQPEARLSLSMTDGPVIELAGGERVQLQQPQMQLSQLAFGDLAADSHAGFRMAPAIHGLGLLDRIPEAEILAQTKRVKRDGVAGRPNRVLDVVSGESRIGRFGWKAVQPTLAQQDAHAFNIDIGMSTTIFRRPAGDCSGIQRDCLAAPNGNSPQFGNVEIAEPMRHLIDTFVSYAMLPPQRQRDTDRIAAGEKLFMAAGCDTCHRPSYNLPATAEIPARRISPYTDLLLHDMGPGLADGVAEGTAGGSEWRTQPLWRLGQAVAGDAPAALLHDGRARTILEAVLWHGGEATAAQQRVVAMSPEERTNLIAFLRSL
ncbi:di-heme oxidoredictase family protein [Dongia soli]|uniref:Di-heme oxidoredictase family protein n=1 Tax=Dongia soli TaxID=600628 RepID=A0ABU5EFJ0_9PROT|nr:di-heme oxidoredictase family protein [Dongia soli]MDY0884981.1 di-heme oxidoredictase family protein [Dongia soli]